MNILNAETKRTEWRGRMLLLVLVTVCALGVRPWRVFAQADSGYTLITTVSTLSATDATIVTGNVYQYEVTAFNGLESTPIKSPVGTAGPLHTASLTWLASPTAGVTYKVYRTQVTVPNPPGVVSVTFN